MSEEALGTIIFYELPAVSVMVVPGSGLEPEWPEGS